MTTVIEGVYEYWRSTVPWTNDEIVAAMRAEADAAVNEFRAHRLRTWADHIERTGRLSTKALGVALPRLIRTCELCGKTAHYRYGNSGRCREHKGDVSGYSAARAKRLDVKWTRVFLNDAPPRTS